MVASAISGLISDGLTASRGRAHCGRWRRRHDRAVGPVGGRRRRRCRWCTGPGGVDGVGDTGWKRGQYRRVGRALWGGRPPESWRQVLAGCVMRLRRVLGAGAIETTPQGYRLAVVADDVDISRFEQSGGQGPSVADARRDRAGGVSCSARHLRCGAGGRSPRPSVGSRRRSRRTGSSRFVSMPRNYGRCPLAKRHVATCWPRRRRWSPGQPLRERRWALLATGPVPGRPAG